MCGIAGIARLDGTLAPGDMEAVRRMLDVQSHRGPDGSGLHRAGRAVLGHRRLAIIDLSAAAAEPMANEDGTVWLTYNGEIYNHGELRDELLALGHCFRSRSDSEVLVHGYEAWGVPGLLDRVEGMFAFGLYDAPRERLVLARDRLGIKPLYYAILRDGTAVAFGSEVRALECSGLVEPDRDPDALLGFLALGAVPAPLTLLRGVRCLRPGHYLVADHQGVAERRYWDFPDSVALADGDPVRDLQERLPRVVARHLVSDVPLGLFLSGGVDSAALAALAHDLVPGGLHTLTVTFGEAEFDEAAAARRLAVAFGTEHHEVPVTAADFLQELPSFFEAMDQPTNDGVNTYFVARAARKVGLTVVLSGVGGDEVFWGYSQHQRLRRGPLGWLPVLPATARSLGAACAEIAGALCGREQWRRLGYLRGSASPDRLYLALRGFFALDQIARLLDMNRGELDTRVTGLLVETGIGIADDPALSFDRYQFGHYLHDQLLRDTDVFGMAHSIEVRVPYLDHGLVERVALVPVSGRLERGLNKPLLCRAVADPMVLELGRRPKRGFTFPMTRWMRMHADRLEEIALGTDTLPRGPVRTLWRQFRAGRLHWSRAWALTVLGARGWTR